MDNLKINWNDDIAHFIKIKATHPHILAELVKLEQQHMKQKSARRKVEHHQSKYNQLASRVFQLNSKLEDTLHQKALLNAQIKKMDKNCNILEWQIDKHARELQENRKTKSSRSSLAITNHTNSERSFPFFKKEAHNAKIANYEHIIHQAHNQISGLIALKISLKEDTQRYRKIITQQQSSAKANQRKVKIKEDLAILKSHEEKARLTNQALSNIYSQKLAEYQKPFKITKKQYALLQQSTKKLQIFVKQAKKLVLSDKLPTSRKYQQFLHKYKQQINGQDLSESQSELSKMLEKHLQLKIIIEEGHALLNMGKYEELYNQMAQQCFKKDITTRDYLQMEQSLQAAQQYLRQLEKRDIALGQQIEAMRKNLDRKSIQLQNEKLRIKSNRSI